MLHASWKTLMIYAILAWGLWGFLGKIVMVRIGWGPAFALTAIANLGLILLIKPESFRLLPDSHHLLGLAMGILSGIGYIYFYKALETAPAAVVVPGTALYIVVAAVLAFLLLGEAVTWNRLLGTGLGLASIYLLSRG